MKISQLEGHRVAIWGYGREGRAALNALRLRLPRQPLTLFCSEEEAVAARALNDPALVVVPTVPDSDDLARFEFVIKSPGISPYRPPVADAAMRGVRFVSGTGLWFAEAGHARTICVTGTKGKSTTTALIAHLLRAGGHRTALAGNIGLPLLELLEVSPPPAFWVIELSSYQTRDAVQPEVAVVLNVSPEHLDWHGSEAQYVADKLALIGAAHPKHAVVPDGDARIAAHINAGAKRHTFGNRDDWHVEEHRLYRGAEPIFELGALALPGLHNRANVAAAMAAIEACGIDPRLLVAHLASFKPLPHRLQSLGTRNGIEYVNDSISTTPVATLAALDCYRDRAVAVIVGGYDRGLDWSGFAECMQRQPSVAVITQGDNGARIAAALAAAARATPFALYSAADLAEAVELAQRALPAGGVILLSPGAPSFPHYRDYAERGRHFAALAGFDPEAIGSIPGLGVS